MKIILNGKAENFDNIKTVDDLITQSIADLPKFFAVEVNKKIIYKEDYSTFELNENDEVEVVIFAGGG